MSKLHFQRLAAFVLLLFSAACPDLISTARAQEKGFAYFAMMSPKFPCDDALKAFEDPSVNALAVLWNTFGNDTSCLAKWFERMKDRPYLLEIHLSNEACRRHKRCLQEEFAPQADVKQYNRLLAAGDPQLISAIQQRVSAIVRLLKQQARGNGEFILSTGLEDNYSEGAYTVMLSTVRAAWPYKVVRSPVLVLPPTPRLSADYIEGHGAVNSFRPGDACIVNLDGQDIIFPHRNAVLQNRLPWDGVKRYLSVYQARCRATFLWAAPWQGIYAEHKFI